MKTAKHLVLHDFSFCNTTENNLSLEQVFQRVVRFMQLDPRGQYKFMIGTDSHVHRNCTLFVIAIVIQRMGKGVWACFRKVAHNRKMDLKEKILMETIYTQQLASFFDREKENTMIDIILPYIYQGASFIKECHLDIGKGKRNQTSQFVNEMMAIIKPTGFEPVIKPNSYVASGYANHYTK
jgi:uncharacterized protein